MSTLTALTEITTSKAALRGEKEQQEQFRADDQKGLQYILMVLLWDGWKGVEGRRASTFFMSFAKSLLSRSLGHSSLGQAMLN